jgi:hypothetical protein
MIDQQTTLVDMDGEPFKSYYHPTCINYPVDGDYIQLLDAQGKPSENHARVSRVLGEFGQALFLVEDQTGESLAITRLQEFDTDSRQAWQEVITATA